MTANELQQQGSMFLQICVTDNKKAAPVSVWSAWLQKMIMRSTCSCPEQQTRSKQLRNKRDNNAFFEGMPESKPCLSKERKQIGLKIPDYIY